MINGSPTNLDMPHASYTYDAAGQRTQSVVTPAGGTTTTSTFAYEGLSLRKLSASQGSASWRLDYLTDEEDRPYGAVYRSPASSTSPLYFSIVTNDRGDVLALADADGAVFAAYRYDAWGAPQGAGNHATGIWTQATSLITANQAGQIATRQILRYASYAYDAESGFYYCSARYYDPATRQWTSADPAKADGEGSAYLYCGGEPVGRTDANGRSYREPWHSHLWGANDKGWRTASWYHGRQLPNTNKIATHQGVCLIYRVGARNEAPKGRWVTWQAYCLQEPAGWWNVFGKRNWVVKRTKRYLGPWQTRTTSVKWISLDLVDTRIRTWGWGGWAKSAGNNTTRETWGWFNLFSSAERK
jgi:RHS repeat-associated protein